MHNLHIILIIILVVSLTFNYLSFISKKTAVQLVNDMGIGYNLGITYNCCNIIEEKNLENEEIKLFGTTIPTKDILKEIRKYGFKTILFQILYNNYTYNNSKINSEWIYKIKKLINLINNLNMYIILSIKHTRQFWYFERRNSKDKYINFWSQIAKELINFDEHLIFETMYEIGYLIYLNRLFNYYEDKEYYLSQDFINIIRDSGGFNIDRLLIIPMLGSDYEIGLLKYYSSQYKIPKDPYNKVAISIYYYFPCEEYNSFSSLEQIKLYSMMGYSDPVYPLKEWGSSQNYKDIASNFDIIKENLVDKGIPVIIGEVGILNDYIKRNNSIEQFLYTLFSMSYEYEGILPCLFDIPLSSSNNKNFYFNKENNEWSNDKYAKIFNRISKGKFIKSFDYYHQTNLETNYYSMFGILEIDIGFKRIVKILVNVKFIIYLDENDIVMTVYSYQRDALDFKSFDFKEQDGKKQYDGTCIFTIDTSEMDLYYNVQAMAWYSEDYMIINSLTVQYKDIYSSFDYLSYKSDILKEINNR